MAVLWYCMEDRSRVIETYANKAAIIQVLTSPTSSKVDFKETPDGRGRG
jgi:hypothetical protein